MRDAIPLGRIAGFVVNVHWSVLVILRAGPPTVHSEIVPAAAVPTLVDMSKDAVLMVVGCLGSGRWPGRLLGSVSSGLLRHAHCPVVIIHDEDSVMPHPQQAPVLVGVDGSSASELATAIAFDEASRRNVDLVALHAWPGGYFRRHRVHERQRDFSQLRIPSCPPHRNLCGR